MTSLPQPPRNSNGYEHTYIHPATEQWLSEHGYSYQHEVIIPVGRIDYLAEHDDGQMLIVECKVGCSDIIKALRQVLDYQRYLGAQYQSAIAVPEWSIDQSAVDACNIRGVHLIGLKVQKKPKTIGFAVKMDPKVAFHDRVLQHPNSIVSEILNFHFEKNTPPLSDLWNISILHDQIVKRRNLSNSARYPNLIDGTESGQVYLSAIDTINELPYRSLKEYTEQSSEFYEDVFREAKKIAQPLLSAHGIVPNEYMPLVYWEARKKAEFYAMADMIHLFNTQGNDENLIFVDDSGNEIPDGDMMWEGSAHSFASAYQWDKWTKENRPSYFSQFSFSLDGWEL